MAKKSSLYTKSGDKGETGLVSGTRVPKSDIRICLYGEIDELNSWVGLICAQIGNEEKYKNQKKFLIKLQSSLFDLGSNFACEFEKRKDYKLPQLTGELVSDIESEINQMDEGLPLLKNFILPGGHQISAIIHICRAICRRVERTLIQYFNSTKEVLPSYSLEFLNRFSDYLFVLSRFINIDMGSKEILWESNRHN